MNKAIPKIPMYIAFRNIGMPHMLPLNFTVSVTYRCNSRCKTCNVWKKKVDEFTLEEFDRVFQNIGKTPYWFTFSGGEPFLRQDLVDICRSAYRHCRPGIINIPTNGILPGIADRVSQIAEACPHSELIVNLSLDGVGEKHDLIRGVPGNFDRAMTTYEELRSLRQPNFCLGIATTISRFNVGEVAGIWELVKKLAPDSYVTEIAEERVELDTIGADITPAPEQYAAAINFLSQEMKRHKFSGISKVTKAFRLQYYGMVNRVLREKRQIFPCYAGFASAHVAPDGDVWTCCIRAEPMGNLRDTGYRFNEVWFGARAGELRQSIKGKECYCPLANASYTNMLCHIPTLARVGWKVITS